MVLDDFKDLLLSADPEATHYRGGGKPNYTVWAEYGYDRKTGNNSAQDRIYKVQIDRFTKIEYDPTADAITAALEAAEIAFSYLCDYEPDTGYIHHIWDCEVV